MLRVLPAELAPLRCEGAAVTVELAVSVVTAWHLERAVPDTARIRVHASEPELRTVLQTRNLRGHGRISVDGQKCNLRVGHSPRDVHARRVRDVHLNQMPRPRDRPPQRGAADAPTPQYIER